MTVNSVTWAKGAFMSTFSGQIEKSRSFGGIGKWGVPREAYRLGEMVEGKPKDKSSNIVE